MEGHIKTMSNNFNKNSHLVGMKQSESNCFKTRGKSLFRDYAKLVNTITEFVLLNTPQIRIK